ncbi:hypothetical protein FH972_023121 [Carpinus fangiana]|uniref:DUF4267 domain-containing protein n=1 Tax=Carpinus fangiana TaxID=176857 RepID=A0A5N6KU92_9ROSI|nr:hypothetical protein FH972_023121 [Carpinus fangiana]
MSSVSWSNIDVPRIGTAGFAALGLTVGIRALYRPRAFAETFGLPQSKAAPHNPFITVVGARNIAGGLALFTFCYLDNKRAIGIQMICGLVTGVTDAVTCYQYGSRDAATGHAVMSILFGALGGYLISRD